MDQIIPPNKLYYSAVKFLNLIGQEVLINFIS